MDIFEFIKFSLLIFSATYHQAKSLASSNRYEVDPSVGYVFSDGCRVGTKYGSLEIREHVTFCNSSLITELLNLEPALFLLPTVYCTADASLPATADAVCKCDCEGAHGATGGHKACVQQVPYGGGPTACWCKYKEGENPCTETPQAYQEEYLGKSGHHSLLPLSGFLRTKREADPSLRQRRSSILSPLKTVLGGIVTGIDDTVAHVFSDVCMPVFETALTLVCESKPLTFGSVTLYGVDLCIIDCICSHASIIPPFGACHKKYDGVLLKEVTLCYCFV